NQKSLLSRNLRQHHHRRCSLPYQFDVQRPSGATSWDLSSRGSFGSCGPASSSEDPWPLIHRRLARRSSQQQKQQQRNNGEEPMKPPKQMSESEAAELEVRYRRKVSDQSAYELVAVFRLTSGRVDAYRVFEAGHRGGASSSTFQLTERRRQLLRRYYGRGTLAVALYVKTDNQFEHYMPLSVATGLEQQRSSGTSNCGTDQVRGCPRRTRRHPQPWTACGATRTAVSTAARNCLYKVCTLFCGIFIALYWGCVFAWVAMEHIWCITPSFKVWEINMACMRRYSKSIVDCCLGPCCETCGLFLSKMRLTQVN
uniref:Anoctamin n=1 Tax=Macrostomum lignano TaxID=282301 RepID=A0A1I8IQM0_9PLAT